MRPTTDEFIEWLDSEDFGDDPTRIRREAWGLGVSEGTVYASIEDLKNSPIVLRGAAAQAFARAKQRRVPRSANPIPFD